MTIIIGLMDKKNRRTYLACDGAVTGDNGDIFETDNDKILKVSDYFIIGITGPSSIQLILEHNLDILLKDLTDENFVIQFKRNVLEIYDKERKKLDENNNIDGNFIVAYKDKLYWCSTSVSCQKRHISHNCFEFTFAGCAQDYAKSFLSALSTYTDLDPEDYLEKTIEHCKTVNYYISPSTKTTIKYIDW